MSTVAIYSKQNGVQESDLKAEEALDLALVGPRKEDIAAAEARLAAYQAGLDLARQRLSDTRLYAPAPGIIRDRILEPGDMAFPQAPVLTLALTDPLWVRAYIPEPSLGEIAPGMRAEVTTDSYPGKTYRGWIGFIDKGSIHVLGWDVARNALRVQSAIGYMPQHFGLYEDLTGGRARHERAAEHRLSR